MSTVSASPNAPRDKNRAFNRGIRRGDCIDACGLSAFVSDSASHLMKIRRSVLLFALVAILIFFSGSASAEESPSGSILTSLTSTTITGYVDTSAYWHFGSEPQPRCTRWWAMFSLWLRRLWT